MRLNPKSSLVKRRAEAGFSLIELMVVILIMGLLATTILVTLAPVGDQSRTTKVQADIAALESALEMYNLDMSRYPAPEAGLAALRQPPAGADAASYRPGGYIKRLRDDPWGNPYQYAAPGPRSASPYDLFSSGPDGQAGTADDIGNWGE